MLSPPRADEASRRLGRGDSQIPSTALRAGVASPSALAQNETTREPRLWDHTPTPHFLDLAWNRV